MSRDAGTAERIYDRLKAALLNGTLSRSARMDFAELATLYGVSTTPVREAAMRLLGEGLIELHPKVGARPVRLSEYRLRALLDAHAKLVHLALNAAIEPVELGAAWADATSDERRARIIFVAIARATGNPELIDIIERLGDRLAPFRLQEERVLGGMTQELGALRTALSSPAQLRLDAAVTKQAIGTPARC